MEVIRQQRSGNSTLNPYKIIDLDNFDLIVQKLDDLLNNFELNTGRLIQRTYIYSDLLLQRIPELKESLTKLNLTVETTSFIRSAENINGVIHTDDNVRLLLPARNCRDSRTVFYQGTNPIDSFVLQQPLIFDGRVPHGIYNFSDKPRISFTIKTVEDLSPYLI